MNLHYSLNKMNQIDKLISLWKIKSAFITVNGQSESNFSFT